jgi:hypothetical protein
MWGEEIEYGLALHQGKYEQCTGKVLQMALLKAYTL